MSNDGEVHDEQAGSGDVERMLAVSGRMLQRAVTATGPERVGYSGADGALSDTDEIRAILDAAAPDREQTGWRAKLQEFQFRVSELFATGARARAMAEQREQVRRQYREALRAYNDAAAAAQHGDNPKLQKLLGKIRVDRQQDMSQSLGENNLSLFLTSFEGPPVGLDGDDRAAYLAVRDAQREAKRLSGTNPDDPLSDADIKKLLSAPGDEDRGAGVALLSAMSLACKRPKVLAAAMKNNPIVPVRYNLSGDSPIDATELQTSFIKAARSKAANMMFQTDLGQRMRKAAAGILDDPAAIDRYIANVGFNRAMSENNFLGASLSSDVDFKLVIDDRALRADHPDLGDEAFAQLKRNMRAQLDQAEAEFRERLGLTLEVQSFTIRDLSEVERLAQTSDTERNFLCTVFENHVCMSGNPEVARKFAEVIRKNVIARADGEPDEPGLPMRNFQQYLGDSDKGSRKAIRHLGDIERALTDLAQEIAADPAAFDAARAKLVADLRKEAGKASDPGEKLALEADAARLEGDRQAVIERLSTPKGMLAALDDARVADKAKTSPHTVLPDVDMFGGPPAGPQSAARDGQQLSRFKLLAKNLKAFTEGGAHRFIGRPGLAASDDWVFSNKYGGCRLNDFFDSTSRERYTAHKGLLSKDLVGPRTNHPAPDVDVLGGRYDRVRKVAIAINRFSVQLQDRIYELYEGQMSHAELDELYARVTAGDLERMVARDDTRAALLTTLDAMLKDLDAVGAEDGDGADLSAKTKAHEARIRSARNRLAGEPREAGFELFAAISDLLNDAADHLDPSRPTPPGPAADVAPAGADPRTRRKTSLAQQDVVGSLTGSDGKTYRRVRRRRVRS